MFGPLGGPELFLILIIALIVFGPRKLPEVGRSVGKMLTEFRRASADFKRTIEGEIEAEKRPSTPKPAQPAAPEPAATTQPPAASPYDPMASNLEAEEPTPEPAAAPEAPPETVGRDGAAGAPGSPPAERE
jgi:TatA/E family protein of Tat protein translocase